jgi:hypothetical protein
MASSRNSSPVPRKVSPTVDTWGWYDYSVPDYVNE